MTAKDDSRPDEINGSMPQNQIARLNNAFRCTCRGGTLMLTTGVLALGNGAVPHILSAVRKFRDFSAANDPYDEHDFGAVNWLDQRILWKIDYYDVDMRGGSPDPGDPSVTTRVLTIMLASEY